MYQIDLLNGKGIPTRNRPEAIVIGIITAVVPVIAFIVLTGFYMHNQISMNILESEIERCSNRIESEKLANAVRMEEKNRKKNKALDKSISEIGIALKRHTQWTPAIEDIVKLLPQSVILTDLRANQKYVKVKKPDPENKGKKIEVSVPRRNLSITLRGRLGSNCDKEVREFKTNLKRCESFEGSIDEVVVSQEVEEIDGDKYAMYFINCVLTDGVR